MVHVSVAGACVLAPLAFCMVSCASFGQQESVEDFVRGRAAKRWELLIAGDYDSAYDFHQPSFKQTRTKASYRNLFGKAVQWTNARVAGVSCAGDVCDVDVGVEMRYMLGFANGMQSFQLFKEKWVAEDGGWWYVHQP